MSPTVVREHAGRAESQQRRPCSGIGAAPGLSGVLDPPPRARLEELGGTSGQGSPVGLPAPPPGRGRGAVRWPAAGRGGSAGASPARPVPASRIAVPRLPAGEWGAGPSPACAPNPGRTWRPAAGALRIFPHPTPLVRFVEGRETAAGVGAGACGPFPRFVPSRLSDLGPGGRAGAGRPVGAVVSPGDPRKWLACRRRGECSALESVLAGVLPLGSVAGPAKGTQLGFPGAPEAVPSAGRSRLAGPMTTACPRRPRGGGDGAFPFWNCFSSFHFPRIFLCSTLSM